MIDQKEMSAETIEMIANRFKVLSDPMRLRILHGLQKGEASVTDIVSTTGTTQPNVSKHLKILHEAGIVVRRQEKNLAFYGIADESIFEMCEVVCNSLKKQAESKMASLTWV